MLKRNHVVWLTLRSSVGMGQSGFAAETNEAAPLEEVVVSGFRESYSNAVKAKREAVGVTDSISSEGLGRFPDLNVGEALQRVPGIQIVDTSGPWTYPGLGPSLTNSAGNVLIVAGSEGRAENDLDGLQFEIERKLDSGWLSGVEFGARYEETSFTSRGRRASAAGAHSENVVQTSTGARTN